MTAPRWQLATLHVAVAGWLLLPRGLEHPQRSPWATHRLPPTPQAALVACEQPSGLPETATCISLATLMHGSTAMAAGRPARGCGRLPAAPSWPGAPTPLTLSHPPLTMHPTGSTGGLRAATRAARDSYVHQPRDADARQRREGSWPPCTWPWVVECCSLVAWRARTAYPEPPSAYCKPHR